MLIQFGHGKVSFKENIYLLYVQFSFRKKNKNNREPALICVMKSIFLLVPAGLI